MADPDGNTAASPHWGWTSVGGQLGGFEKSTLKNLAGDLYQANNGEPGAKHFFGYANGGNSIPYADWELY